MQELFRSLGFNTQDLVAGFAGGLTRIFLPGASRKPFDAVGSVLIGAVTANYLTETVMHTLGTGSGLTGFVIGLCGMSICHAIILGVRNWRPIWSNRESSKRGSQDV